MSKSTKAPANHIKFAVLATDIALFTIKDEELYVRTIVVNRPPHFVHVPGLPGGLLLPTETAEEAIARILRERGLIQSTKPHLEQLYTFSALERDPKGRVVSVGYLGLIPWSKLSEEEQTNSDIVQWMRVRDIKTLAYDHNEMLAVAVKRLRSRISYTTLISQLLPDEFTLTEMKDAYEAILGTPLDKRNFRKKILKLDILSPLQKERAGEPWRPAQLYGFKEKKIKEIEVL